MVYSLHKNVCRKLRAFRSHSRVEFAKGFVGSDRNSNLTKYGALIDRVIERECGDSGFRIAVGQTPLDGSGTAKVGKERAVNVERTVGRHVPHHLGKHAKGNHRKNIGVESGEFRQKFRIAQFLWLQKGY